MMKKLMTFVLILSLLNTAAVGIIWFEKPEPTVINTTKVYNRTIMVNHTIYVENDLSENITAINEQLNLLNTSLVNLQENLSELAGYQEEIALNLEDVKRDLRAMNATLYAYITPPVKEEELYKGGVVITAPAFFIAVSASPLVSYDVVFSISDVLRVAPSLDKMDEIKEIINWTNITHTLYFEEIHDCDDYAYTLYAIMKQHYPMLAFGVMHSRTHAYNYIIFANTEKHYYEIYFIEPQTGEFLNPEDLPRDSPYFPITFILF